MNILNMTRKTALALFAAAVLAPSVAFAQYGEGLQSDARERAPAALLGTWEVDVAASDYGDNAPLSHFRSFHYTADGDLMVSFLTLNAAGEQSAAHWVIQLDGKPGYEYHSDNGSTPIAEIALTMADPHTFHLTNSRAGELRSRAMYRLAEDGQTLTLIRAPGTDAERRFIYRRWGAQ